jgi:hypothetical protein
MGQWRDHRQYAADLQRAFETCATPLVTGETRRVKSVICPTAKAEYFSQQGWTGLMLIFPSG